jgi:hypothetical protein
MRKIAKLVAMTVLLGGCGWDRTATAPEIQLCFFMCDGITHRPVLFELSPDHAIVLLGDTVRFRTWSCPTGDYGCGTAGNLAANWAIRGDAATLIHPSGLHEVAEVLLRAHTTGKSQISAWSVIDTLLRQTSELVVVDSSAVTMVTMSGFAVDSIEAGRTVTSTAWLRMEGYEFVRGLPTEWAVSDTAVAEFSGSTISEYGFESRALRLKQPGQLEIIARFRDVADTVRLRVVR